MHAVIEEYYGKKCKHCYAMGGRLNFQSNGISLCHSLECEDPYLDFVYGNDNLAVKYLEGIKSLLDSVNSSESTCGCNHCSMLSNELYTVDKIQIITINTSTRCNARCLYCCSHNGESGNPISIIPYIQQLEQRELISKDCFFDYGGGESTLDPFFAENVMYIAEKNYMLRVNTNAFEFSELLSNIIGNHTDYYIRVSIDAGTPETYRKLKGFDKYYDVWNNVERYMSHNSNVMVKYVLCETNCGKSDIEGFVNCCKEFKVKEVYIDIDHGAYAAKDNMGWSIYSQNLFDAAWHMKRYAEDNGILGRIGYVWTARNISQQSFDYNIVQRDRNGKRYLTSVNEIRLPDHFEDNTEKGRKNYSIIYEKYNNIGTLLNCVDKCRVVLYGAGKNGNKLIQRLEIEGIKPVGVSDTNAALYGKEWNGYIISSLMDLYQKYGVLDVILTPTASDEILRTFNGSDEYGFLKHHLYYINDQDY